MAPGPSLQAARLRAVRPPLLSRLQPRPAEDDPPLPSPPPPRGAGAGSRLFLARGTATPGRRSSHGCTTSCLRTDLWSDQILVLRAVQSLTMLDLHHNCELVWNLGGYTRPDTGDSEPERATPRPSFASPRPAESRRADENPAKKTVDRHSVPNSGPPVLAIDNRQRLSYSCQCASSWSSDCGWSSTNPRPVSTRKALDDAAAPRNVERIGLAVAACSAIVAAGFWAAIALLPPSEVAEAMTRSMGEGDPGRRRHDASCWR